MLMKSHTVLLVILSAILLNLTTCTGSETEKKTEEKVQASIILTVSEGKRLIAKAVTELPKVKNALKNGMVIITKGTTNTYVAEELLNKKIKPGAFIYGRVKPEKDQKGLPDVKPMPEVIFVKGEHKKDMSLKEAVKKLEAGDVVIKGANALNYRDKTAAVMAGSSTGGTTGKFLPTVVARKVHLIIPVGLEKQVSSEVLRMHLKMQQSVESLNFVPSMFLLPGEIFTEIEALNLLADVDTFQAGAGGISGAEGASWLVVRGSKENVKKALKIAEQVQGEPPFVKNQETDDN